MRFPIDVIFLNRDLRVVKLCPDLQPFRIGPFCRGAYSVLECEAGFIARNNIAIGYALEFASNFSPTSDHTAACFRIG